MKALISDIVLVSPAIEVWKPWFTRILANRTAPTVTLGLQQTSGIKENLQPPNETITSNFLALLNKKKFQPGTKNDDRMRNRPIGLGLQD